MDKFCLKNQNCKIRNKNCKKNDTFVSSMKILQFNNNMRLVVILGKNKIKSSPTRKTTNYVSKVGKNAEKSCKR